jgi:hypothetical protein
MLLGKTHTLYARGSISCAILFGEVSILPFSYYSLSIPRGFIYLLVEYSI